MSFDGEEPATNVHESEPAAPAAAEESHPSPAAAKEPEAPVKDEAAKTSEAAPAPAPEVVGLKVVSQDGSEVYFKIKKHTMLKKLVDAYCTRQGVSPSSIRFLYDGRRIQPDQTPKDLGMEDGDIIDAMLQQTGGH